MFVKRFSRALVVTTTATLIMASAAFADQISVDGDSDVLKVGNNIQYVVTPGAQAQQRACTTRGTAVTGTATLDYSGGGNNHFAAGETADVTYTEATASDITVTGPATITIPSDWNDATDTHAFNFSTTTPSSVANGTYSIEVQVVGRTSGLEKAQSFLVDIDCGTVTVCNSTFTATFLKPFDGSDPASLINNTVKNGRVAPVKVDIFEYDCNGVLIGEVRTGTVTLNRSTLSGQLTGQQDPLENYADAGASSGNTNAFRWTEDALTGEGFWIYNLDTKALSLSVNQPYRIDVYLNGTKITNTWGVFTPTK